MGSKEQRSCRENCPEPCQYIRYDTQVTTGALLEDGISKDLVTFLEKQKNSSLAGVYVELLDNKTAAERREYVRYLYATIWGARQFIR